ncbi:hypothetical protein ACFWQK_02845 [Brachybacterium paraconglomeratum]
MPTMPPLTPAPAQLAWQRDGLGVFFHVGVTTFGGGEWSDGRLPPEIFDPSDLDGEECVALAIPPDRRGRIDPADAARVRELAAALRDRFGDPQEGALAAGGSIGARRIRRLPAPVRASHLRLETEGEGVVIEAVRVHRPSSAPPPDRTGARRAPTTPPSL